MTPSGPHDEQIIEEDDLLERYTEQSLFVLNSEQWTEFMAALDAPPRDLPRLRRLLSEPSFFEQAEP